MNSFLYVLKPSFCCLFDTTVTFEVGKWCFHPKRSIDPMAHGIAAALATIVPLQFIGSLHLVLVTCFPRPWSRYTRHQGVVVDLIAMEPLWEEARRKSGAALMMDGRRARVMEGGRERRLTVAA